MIRILLLTIILLPMQTSNKRVLAIYVKSGGNAKYQQQIKMLSEDKAGLADRNIEIKTYTYSDATAAVFKKNRITGDFVITLTGKDGGEKHRSAQLITLRQLYGIIDAMPMRKEEMKM